MLVLKNCDCLKNIILLKRSKTSRKTVKLKLASISGLHKNNFGQLTTKLKNENYDISSCTDALK